jgi:2-methylisocitrate lyase-like PEP mutase family enzyme
MTRQTPQQAAFRRLHESGCFVMPNPWDVGSARYLQSLGFPALASTSAGLAFGRGLPDRADVLSRELVLQHVAELVAATELPVNADFQAGYADTPTGVAESVRQCVHTGVAGLSIEDATGDAGQPLFDLPEAVERLRAARESIDASGAGVLLTGRAECFLVGHADPLAESIRRLRAYADAGADVLYAPGLPGREEIREVIAAAHPRPVNVLMSSNSGLTVADLAELGVRRISTGSALARSAWGGFMRAARLIAEQGSFAGLESAASFAELNQLFDRNARA